MTDKTDKKGTVRSRFKPQITAGLHLEERDRELLTDLLLHRAMARGQIQALYFSSLVRCNARLRQLFDHGFVRRYYHPAAPYGAQAIYLCGKNAVSFVARRLEMDLVEVSKQVRGNRTPTFIEHTLAIVDMRIAFMKAVKENSEFEIERWLAEPLCRHEYEIRVEGGAWRKEVFKPDAFIRLLHKGTGEYLNFFLEVDMGHTSSQQFLGKVLMYRRYMASGLFRETYGGESFKTLVITTGERRVKNLGSKVEPQDDSLFILTTHDKMTRQDILQDI